MHSYSKIKVHVLKKLNDKLPSYLTYHNTSHTLDVLEQAEIIATESGVVKEEELLLLKVSALYHDTGFVSVYGGHEEKSCEIVKEELPRFGFSDKQIKYICGLIRATKIPQQPQNDLEKIICDADLDYLGRPDFYSIGEGLFKEFKHQHIVSDELQWNQLQVRFLENHTYFTDTCKRKRESLKQQHLAEVKQKVTLVS